MPYCQCIYIIILKVNKLTNSMTVFDYIDYRLFLKDKLAELKENNSRFSFRLFARLAGLSSPGYLKMVMDGERNLSPTSINQFAKGLKLGKKEAMYFEALVLFKQAKSEAERDMYLERLSALKPQPKLMGISKDQFEYFTHHYYVVIREMVALPDFKEDEEWIASHMSTPIKAKEAREAIDTLLRLGLVHRDEDGKLVQADGSLTTEPEVASVEVFNFHRNMLNEAKAAMIHLSPESRDITSLTIPIPKDFLPEIKHKIQELRETIIHTINNGPPHYHEVYQINIQLFPVTTTKSDEAVREETPDNKLLYRRRLQGGVG